MMARRTQFPALAGLACCLCFRDRRCARPPTPSTVSPEIVAALKGLKGADAAKRHQAYDLIADKGDAQSIPALKAYRDGALQIVGDRLALYGPRVTLADKGSVLPLLDAVTGEPIAARTGSRSIISSPIFPTPSRRLRAGSAKRSTTSSPACRCSTPIPMPGCKAFAMSANERSAACWMWENRPASPRSAGSGAGHQRPPPPLIHWPVPRPEPSPRSRQSPMISPKDALSPVPTPGTDRPCEGRAGEASVRHSRAWIRRFGSAHCRR